MVSGRLTEKNGYFYIVLSYKGPDGKRVQKWQGTGLPVKGNKKKAEDLLRQARHSFTPPAPDRSTDLSPDMLFSDYMLYWLKIIRTSVEPTTWSSYCFNVKDHTPAQQAIMADFIMRAEAIRTGRVKPEEDNMLKLTGEARLMAIDPRLIRPDADGTGSKLSVCIEDVYQVWKDTAASASTQLVFCDVGTPKAGKFNVYDEIRNVLLAKGVPESEIAFVHDATSEAQRQELFERTRQGKVRILIGSTSKLGTGVNVQNMGKAGGR